MINLLFHKSVYYSVYQHKQNKQERNKLVLSEKKRQLKIVRQRKKEK